VRSCHLRCAAPRTAAWSRLALTDVSCLACLVRGDVTKPASMCYYLEPVKRDMSQPMANGLPADAICKKLRKHDDALCAMEWGDQLKTGKTKPKGDL
jgi:hypothetical protein